MIGVAYFRTVESRRVSITDLLPLNDLDLEPRLPLVKDILLLCHTGIFTVCSHSSVSILLVGFSASIIA